MKKELVDYAHKAYFYTMFENFSKQSLWKLHGTVKKIRKK